MNQIDNDHTLKKLSEMLNDEGYIGNYITSLEGDTDLQTFDISSEGYTSPQNFNVLSEEAVILENDGIAILICIVKRNDNINDNKLFYYIEMDRNEHPLSKPENYVVETMCICNNFGELIGTLENFVELLNNTHQEYFPPLSVSYSCVLLKTVFTPQELTSLIKEKRYYDVMLESNDICWGSGYCREEVKIFPEKVVVRGKDENIEIIATDNYATDNYDGSYFFGKWYYICVCRKDIDYRGLCLEPSRMIGTTSLDEIFEELEKYDLYRESPLVKKCI